MEKVKFKTVSELKQEATRIVTDIMRTGTPVVITKNGKPVVIISGITESEFRIEKIREKEEVV